MLLHLFTCKFFPEVTGVEKRSNALLWSMMLFSFFALFPVYSENAPKHQVVKAVNLSPVQSAAVSGFGCVNNGNYYTIDSGAGLVFEVNSSSGDITSLKFNNGPEMQLAQKGSHISSGLGKGTRVSVDTSHTDILKITLIHEPITHYLVVKRGINNIYMATYVTAEPQVGELRWITRLRDGIFTNVPSCSNLTGTNGNVESKDIFGVGDGTTHSKFYGNQQAKDLTIRGVTGSGVGVFMAYGNRESSSGGPFFRDIQNQTFEVYNYMNSGHGQTEPVRVGVLHGPYALCFTNGSTPLVPDMSFMGDLGLTGWVPTSVRGSVVGKGLSGMNPAFVYTVGFSNQTAQYWTTAKTSDGSFECRDMKPGIYKMIVYKGELDVSSADVTVTTGTVTSLDTQKVTDPSTAPVIWRIGDWDGTPLEFNNGGNISQMHPSDKRNASWGPTTYVVGSDTAKNFPAILWKGQSNPTTIKFNLTANQVVAHTVRIGITTSFAGGRPQIQVNGWGSPLPKAPAESKSRTLTIGTYRAYNTMFTYQVPASAFVSGENTMTVNVQSGSGSPSGWLSACVGIDCVDMY